MSAGATGELINVIADQLVWERNIKTARAAELLADADLQVLA